jgi:hypothetical protein
MAPSGAEDELVAVVERLGEPVDEPKRLAVGVRGASVQLVLPRPRREIVGQRSGRAEVDELVGVGEQQSGVSERAVDVLLRH